MSMKKTFFGCILTGILCVLLLVGCSSGRADSKYTGKYISVAGEALGITMTGEDIQGFGLELLEGGKATITLEGDTENIKWTNDDTNITLKINGQEVVGEIGTDTIKFVNLLDMGLDLTFAKEGTDAANPENYLSEDIKKMLGEWTSYKVTDILGEDVSGETAADGMSLNIKADKSVQIACNGQDLGSSKWEAFSNSVYLDNGINWELQEDGELKVSYSTDDFYYIYYCKQ